MFTNDELQTLSVLLRRANITGQEALPVALLQQKIESLLKEETSKEVKKDKK